MWEIKQSDDGLVHVLPVKDLDTHYPKNCPCKPRENEDGVLVHNSYDGREKNESNGSLDMVNQVWQKEFQVDQKILDSIFGHGIYTAPRRRKPEKELDPYVKMWIEAMKNKIQYLKTHPNEK